MNLVDTHCHLYFDQFDHDRQAVLERAAKRGVGRILVPGIDLQTSQAAVELAQVYPAVYAAVGVHPNDALSWDASTLSRLHVLASDPKVVAIGEIGLDYYRQRAPHDVQMRVLLEQLQLAAELGLPVVIHNREAGTELLPVLSAWQTGLAHADNDLAERPGVLHSFSDAESTARQAIDLNFRIGFTGPVTFRNAAALQAVAAALPLDALLVETDAPFLAPHPHRGQRNEPAYVRLVAEKLAELHAEAFETTAEITTANAARLFRW